MPKATPKPKYVTCESVAAIVLHVREVGTTPISYSGFAQRPRALCETKVAWDTKISVELASCRTCRALAGLD